MSTRSEVQGTWLVQAADVVLDQVREPLYGAHPVGTVVFTEDLHFSVVLSDGDVPPFVSGDRMSGTPEEDHASVTRTLGLTGTYTVDSDGRFESQVVLASTFPNWRGLRRDTAELTETVDGDLMHERLVIDERTRVEITWRRAGSGAS